MIELLSDESDDPGFIELAGRAMTRAATLASTSFLHVVKLDNWFGDRWFSFAGKACGALAYRNADLRVPPFHPHRVVVERRFDLRCGILPVDIVNPVHQERSSESNLNNSIRFQGRDITLAWYSGGSMRSKRGAIMVYFSGEYVSGWYIGLERRNDWQVTSMIGIDARQWLALVDVPPLPG